MASRVSAVLFVLILVAVPVATAAATPATAGHAQQATPTQTDEPITEETTFILQLQSNGDAQWTITDTYALEDENDTRAFEQLAGQYTDDEADIGWEQSFREASQAATAATGREMTITNVSRRSTVSDGRGTLELTFTWTNFARSTGSRLIVQDGFNTTDGTWFPRLYENQTLIISPPEGYGVTSAPETDINDGSLRFEGPQTFEPGYLNIVYEGNPSPIDGTVLAWLAVSLLAALGLAVLVRYLQRTDGVPVPDVGTDATESDPASDSGETANDGLDVELLSDEERVERLLEDNGGRMKQARIVEETGWSNAKVSQLLSSMDDSDRIDKLRIGRENLISFPDEDVTEIED